MSMLGKEFDEAAAKLNRLLAEIAPVELREVLSELRQAAKNLLEVTEKLKEIANKFNFKE